MPEQRKKVGEKTATEEETEKKMRKKRKKNHYYEKEEKKLLLIAIESICRLLFTRIDRSDKKRNPTTITTITINHSQILKTRYVDCAFAARVCVWHF